MSMPGRLKGVLAIVAFQILANGFVGFLALDAISEEESHGGSLENAGLIYFLAFFSLAVAVTLLVSAVLTPSRLFWIRPTIIGIEVLGLAGGAISLFTGQVQALLGILLAIGVITMLNREEVKDWYER
jgi:hypothetical protein